MIRLAFNKVIPTTLWSLLQSLLRADGVKGMPRNQAGEAFPRASTMVMGQGGWSEVDSACELQTASSQGLGCRGGNVKDSPGFQNKYMERNM